MRKDFTRTFTTERYIYVIAYDRMAGKRDRYTTHVINRYGQGSSKVIGRELTLAQSKKIMTHHQTSK